ncbi:MAG: transcriptional regulator, Crp/Fnr family protein [Herbinix sp.]|jgi:CRP-like cAMP-binding protein|nr:transcriptional regulator, Crp/Fnr family protein [Herbinix sp.]
MKNVINLKLCKTFVDKHKIASYLSTWDYISIKLVFYKKGEFLYTYGSSLENFIFVVQGNIKLSSTGKDGEYHHLNLYQDFAVIGDVEYILECPATADVEALTDVYCIEIPLSTNRSYLDQDIVFQRYLNKLQAQKLSNMDTMEMHKEVYRIEVRLACYLINLQYKEKDTMKDLKKISFQLHCSYRQLLRVIQKMTLDGIFEHGSSRGNYLIKNISALKALAKKADIS